MNSKSVSVKSMTAFARIEGEQAFGGFSWELRSVNHRYLEPSFRLPEKFRAIEPQLRERLRNHASRGKIVRAEPVAALYEQGRVAHVAGLAKLEDQMLAMLRSGFVGRGSPDRVDALVWALTELMVKHREVPPPRVRSL